MSTTVQVLLGSRDMDESISFYDHAFSNHLGWESTSLKDNTGQAYTEDGVVKILLWRFTANSEPATAGNGSETILVVEKDDLVDKIYASALEHGGTDEGAPGVREGNPCRKAYFRDPTGYKWLVIVSP